MSGDKVVLSGQVPTFQSQGTEKKISREEAWTETLSLANTIQVTALQTQLAKVGEENKRLKEKNAELELLVCMDSLTGAYNRRYLDETAQKMIANEIRAKRSWGVLMMDIDYFKKCNDDFGHNVGDKVLINVVKMLQHISRKGDFVIRYGGEEFCVLIFDIDADELEVIAERYRKAVASTYTPFLSECGNEESISITVSVGACFVPSDSTMELEYVTKLADKALYDAKDSGRNCVLFHDRRKVKNEECCIISDRRQ